MRSPGSTHGLDRETRDGRRLSRRVVLAGVTTGIVGSLAGCLKNPSFPEADVIAGADDQLLFDPAELSVSVGETVRWGFASPGHNISCRPEDEDGIVLPDGAEPFSSYGPDQDPEVALVSRGETYEHTFEVVGQYTYVCIPHADNGMVGTIRIE